MTSPVPDPNTALFLELRKLQRQQLTALETAAYIKMDLVSLQNYDLRAKRISEIIDIVSKD